MWSIKYILSGYFDLCANEVDLSLTDLTTGTQAPPIFKSTYTPEDNLIELSCETNNRTFLGNYKIALSFTQPTVKTLPSSSHLLDITITDPCNADIWSDSSFENLAYTIGETSPTKTINISNSLSVDFCEFKILSVEDDWSNSLAASDIVSADNTGTTLTLHV